MVGHVGLHPPKAGGGPFTEGVFILRENTSGSLICATNKVFRFCRLALERKCVHVYLTKLGQRSLWFGFNFLQRWCDSNWAKWVLVL